MENKNTPRKTILILSGPMGSGHVRAALALKDILLTNHPDDHIIYADTTNRMSLPIRWIFLVLYPFLLTCLPSVWRLIHSMNDHSGKGLFTFLFHIFSHRLKRRIQSIVKRKNVDLIICTHFYPGFVVDEMKQEKLLSIPATLVVTDHVGNRIYARKNLDLIFVPNEISMEKFMSYGIKRENLRISPPPVFSHFRSDYTEEDLMRFHKELNLNSKVNYVMLIMGGMALGNMKKIAKEVLKSDKDFTLLVMTATRRELFRQFVSMSLDDERILPIPYTDQIEKYMALCFCIITKPGGITTSECIAMQKPMFLVEPIAGHEEANLKYLVDRGFGLTPQEGESLVDAGKRMKTAYETIVGKMKEYSPKVTGAAAFITDESRKLIPGKEE